jgi:NAD(P)-dependent dehydrogenase (short-subunit alcohol dehydrogenase family)
MTQPAVVEIRDRVVVVTGAARGIGRAIAEKMSAEGARVVVNDLNAASLDEVANAIGGLAVPGDAASEDGVAALIETTTAQLGPIDVFIGNAGVVGIGDVEAPESAWSHTLEVNLMAHVRAARLLVPGWVERGGGRMIITASAAGLLTAPGAAPYAASKHAAVAFAEWLSMTYGDHGVVVQCICPQGVDTDMLNDLGDFGKVAIQNGTIAPADVAEEVWRGMQDNRSLILPHPEVRDHYISRATDTDRWLRGIRRLLLRLG